MYDILCTADDNAHTLSHQTTVFMMSHPLKAWKHSPCIRHHTHSISVISLSPLTSHPLLYDITANFCVTSYELYITSHAILMSSHYSTYDITASIYETTSSMRATYTLNMWHHSHYLCHHTHCLDIITPTLFMTSHSPYVCHRLHYTRHHILTFSPQTTILRTSHPLYYTSCPLYTNPIDDITATICMISHPVYVRHSFHYIYDIIPTRYDNRTLRVVYTTLGICMTSVALQKTSHPLHHTKPQSLWLHIHFRHDITAPVSDIAPTVSFVITTFPLISHPLLYDITPTICVSSYALYITSYPLLLSSHYSTYDSTTLTYETTSSMQFKIYIILVTSQSLVFVITPTLLRASHPLFVWHHTRYRYSIPCTIEDITSSLYEIKAPFLWHCTHYIWHRIDAISVTTSTLLMISHQIYLWDLILYICRHHIHCIQQHIHYIFPSQPLFLCLTPTLCMMSHPLYIWHCTHYMFNIRYSI